MAGYPGKQGRKPVPTALKLLRGNPGRRPLNEDEPKAVPGIPKPPKELSASAKKEWRKVAQQLLKVGLVTELDGMALAALVQSYARWREVQDLLDKTGFLVTDKDNIPRLNPLLRLSELCQKEYTRMLGEFGLTPSSRSRISVDAPADTDPFDEFLKSKKA